METIFSTGITRLLLLGFMLLNNLKTKHLFLLIGFSTAAIAQDTRLPTTHTEMQQKPRLSSLMTSGGWEAWGSWTTCSRSCGGGIRERRRNCRGRQTVDNTQAANVFCNGTDKVHQPCNYKPCPDGSVNTRSTQCSKYNSRLFSGSTYVWETFTKVRPCELKCKARGHRFFISHASTTTDGADCSYSLSPQKRRLSRRGEIPKYICVEGHCKVVGCDGTVGSGLTVDKCGVCGGNGETCQVVKGLFRQQHLSNDFHPIARIPIGAIRINITESVKTRSYIALRSGNPDGNFYINGELQAGRPDPSQSYRVAGTVFRYDRPFNNMDKGETILADGPTNEALEVLLYNQGENPGIFFEYTIPRRQPPSIEPTRQRSDMLDINGPNLLDQYPIGRPGPNRPNFPMGPGQVYRPQSQQPRPLQYPANHPAYQNRFHHTPNWYHNPHHNQVPPSSFRLPSGVPYNGNGRQKAPTNSGHYPQFWQRPNTPINPVRNVNPPRTNEGEESSNTRREAIIVTKALPESVGETEWRTRGFGPCTKSCAEGKKSTLILCVSTQTDQEVDPRLCTGPRPRMRIRKCNRHSCPAHYDATEWSECSKTCGTGRRTRNVLCRQQYAGNFTAVVSHKRCRGQVRPSTHEKCKERDCARWTVDEGWSECNARCGSGIQSRRPVCKAGDGSILPDASCPGIRRPKVVRSCEAGPCVSRWYVTDWEECSADCDRGLQMRHVFCLNTAGATAGCPSKFEPNSNRTCARSSCGTKYEWFSGTWGPCSSKCGNGKQERKVTCVSVEPDGTMAFASPVDGESPCDVTEKPATQQQCNTHSCGSRWYNTPWSACSVSCGGGSRSRDVQCLDVEGGFSSLCNFASRPKETERCNTASCSTLRNPNCEDRVKNCRTIHQARLCAYPHFRKMCCSTCSQANDESQHS